MSSSLTPSQLLKARSVSPLVTGVPDVNPVPSAARPAPQEKRQDAREVLASAAVALLRRERAGLHREWLALLAQAMTAGTARPAEVTLLAGLRGRLSGFESSGVPAGPWQSLETAAAAAPAGGVMIFDFSRDELQGVPSGQRRYGIPLELQLVGWVALISRALAELPRDGLPLAVPRSLLMELLWPEKVSLTAEGELPVPRRALELRLTKLLQRAEQVHGFKLRPVSGRIGLPEAEASRIRVQGDPAQVKPSYFETEGPLSARGFSDYYGLGASQGRALFRGWQRRLESAGAASTSPTA